MTKFLNILVKIQVYIFVQLDEPSSESQQIKVEPAPLTSVKQQEFKPFKAQFVSIEDFLSSDKQLQKIKTEKSKSSLNTSSAGVSLSNSNDQKIKKDNTKSN
jgi:hypothetical protein